MKNPLRTIVSAVAGALQADSAEPETYGQRMRRQLASESGARAEHERLLVLIGFEASRHTPKARLARAQLDLLKRLLGRFEMLEELTRTAKLRGEALAQQASFLADAQTKLQQAEDLSRDAMAVLKERQNRYSAIRAQLDQETRDSELASAQQVAELNRKLYEAEARNDDDEASSIADSIQSLRAQAANARSSGSSASIRASVLSAQLVEAETAVQRHAVAVKAASEEVARIQFEVQAIHADELNEELLLSAIKLNGAIDKVRFVSGYEFQVGRQLPADLTPKVQFFNPEHVAYANRRGSVTNSCQLTPGLVGELIRLEHHVDLSVFEVDPATVSDESKGEGVALAGGNTQAGANA